MTMPKPQWIARRTFLMAASYGVLALLPQYFLEGWISWNFPPPVTHPESFYGFIGVALAWQVVFFMIASDIVRYRPLMPVAVLEKAAFGIPVMVLFIQGRVDVFMLAVGLIDLGWGIAFAMAYHRTRNYSISKVSSG